MSYIKLISLLLVSIFGCFFTSCEETAEVDEFSNWQTRNVEYIDDIAQLAEANADGKWMRILSFKLNEKDDDGNLAAYGNEDYIYCYVIEEGEGIVHPLYTDIVSVNYRGHLIPTDSYPNGMVFDESYKGTFNPALDIPKNFSVDDLVVGWSTALMHMVEGDIWRIYIPSNLGYGSSEKTDIPAYSTLIFDINLAKVIN